MQITTISRTAAAPTNAEMRAQDPKIPAIAAPATPAIIERVFAESGFGDDDLDALEKATKRLPGGGLRELRSTAVLT